MTRIGGLPTARGLLRICRARARSIAIGSNRRTQFPFCQCAGANPRGFPKSPFRSYSQAAGRARSLRVSRCTHRAHGARARKAREIREARETCQGSSCRRRRAARRQGGRAVRRSRAPSAARAACSTTTTPPSNPAKPANPAILPHQESPVAQANPHFGSDPETVKRDLPTHECGGFLIQRRHADKTEVLSGAVSSTGITSARSGPSFTEDGFAFFVRRSFFLVFGL